MDDWHSEANDPLARERGICLEKDCKVKKFYKVLQTCQDRVQSRSQTAETCHQEVMDLMGAVDHCVGAKAFKDLV
ncbi:cytochrome b-c1 complex subunit 6, mitochondrial-like [Epargyreus clarus]|uniref:cytochrome b-c1 complex subunit 6, mitochondrial-like n=1 Tax=Epargyreus clarus TaxID=520877 RepID=UPI003C2C7E36